MANELVSRIMNSADTVNVVIYNTREEFASYIFEGLNKPNLSISVVDDANCTWSNEFRAQTIGTVNFISPEDAINMIGRGRMSITVRGGDGETTIEYRDDCEVCLAHIPNRVIK